MKLALASLLMISVLVMGVVGYAEAEIIELKTDKQNYDFNDSVIVISGEIADRYSCKD